MVLAETFQVESPNVVYDEQHITSTYEYASTQLERAADGKWLVRPSKETYQFRTDRRVPKLG
jgi:myo-inositol-1-phosphate synthase